LTIVEKGGKGLKKGRDLKRTIQKACKCGGKEVRRGGKKGKKREKEAIGFKASLYQKGTGLLFLQKNGGKKKRRGDTIFVNNRGDCNQKVGSERGGGGKGGGIGPTLQSG